jgi:rhamnosyl/mannosyltransferase
VIPFGIGQEHFDEPDSAGVAGIREKYGNRTILTVGRLVSYKGIEFLIRAMTSVNGRLLIAGDGPLRSRLIELSASLGVQDRVVFLGSPNAEELRCHYHAADIFALASVARSEAFGLVQAEAMAASKPVINTALASGVPFVSQHGQTGITVPPGDSVALAGAINKLLDDDELRLKLAGAARLRAETVFRAEVMTAQIAGVYDMVLERRRESATVGQPSLVSRPEQVGQ